MKRRAPIADDSGRRCKLDGYELVIGTNGDGATVARCVACDRRRRHQCQDCGAPVRGRAWRCATHQLEAKRRQTQLHGERYRDERNAAYRKRYHALPKSERPARSERKRRWRQANVARVKLLKRRGRLDGTWGYSSREKYLATQERFNRDPVRAQKKREQALKRYYELHPKRPDPKCLTCGEPIAWDGRGRPALRCAAHNPWRRESAA